MFSKIIAKGAPSAAPNFAALMRIALSLLVAFLGAFAAFRLIRDGFYPLASIIIAIAVFVVLILLKKSLSPWRWLATGLVLAVLFTVFPILYTVYLSFTNMSGGHLVTQSQAIAILKKETVVNPDAPVYAWQAYKNSAGDYLVVLTDPEGKRYLARENQAVENSDLVGDLPPEIQGYTQLDAIETLQNIQAFSELKLGVPPRTITIQGVDGALETEPRFDYVASKDVFVERVGGASYHAVDGTYTSDTGAKLSPGFIAGNGTENYTRFLGNDGYRKPILEIIIWNISFSLLSVLFSFGLGLLIALIFERLPGKRVIRALLIVPYPIPVLVSIMVWRGLLNENMGLVTTLIQSLFGVTPHFFTDITLARFAVILINVYLSYPYFYILCSGALKSIPVDLYEAADMDGASPFQALRNITLPMLLRILAPLLIASFCFNFNNFTIIWGYNAGLPAMADTIVPMGHTDLLVSFIYRLGFSTSGAADYGFSAAITVVLFLFVSIMVFFQTLNTKLIKESK